VFFVFLISVFGCTSTEEKRAMRQNEITNLYNEYVEEVTTLSKEEILSKCDLAIEKFPDLAIAYELKGLIFWDEGELKPAWENYQKAVELAPFDADTLANAREVGLLLNGTFIRVDENGKVQTLSFKKISLEEYGQCTEGVRFKVCMISLGIGEAVKKKILSESKTETYVFVDQNGNEIEEMERMTFGISFEGNSSASELDNWLIQQTSTNPQSTLGEVLWRFTAERMNYGRID
jgi:tetratricopeptide (TPR) repeat protein